MPRCGSEFVKRVLRPGLLAHQENMLFCFLGFLGGGFKYFLFSPLFGEDEPILTNIFQMG